MASRPKNMIVLIEIYLLFSQIKRKHTERPPHQALILFSLCKQLTLYENVSESFPKKSITKYVGYFHHFWRLRKGFSFYVAARSTVRTDFLESRLGQTTAVSEIQRHFANDVLVS
jgi:hypothetical protein